MKSYLLAFVLLFLTACNNSPYETQSAREQDELKGLVKKVFTIEYSAINSFGQGDIIRDRPITSHIIVYDSLGNRINKTDLFFADIELVDENTFNENGMISEYVHYYKNGGVATRSYKYNDKGDLTHDISRNYNGYSMTTYNIRYNNLGQKTHSISNDGTYTEVTTYKYKGLNLIEELEDKSYGLFKNTYSYDKNNNRIQEKHYVDNTWTKTINNYYNELNQLVKRKTISAFNKRETIEGYEFYSYDNYGRKIDYIKTKIEDYDSNDIISRTSWHYDNDSATTPDLIQKWNSDGILYYNKSFVVFTTNKDTSAYITYNNDEIEKISIKEKRKNGSYYKDYRVETESEKTTYNYLEGRLVSVIRPNGDAMTFEYDNNELIKTIETTSGDLNIKEISHYKNGNLQKTYVYNTENDTLFYQKSYSYTGNSKDGTITTTTNIVKNNIEKKQIDIYTEGKKTQSIYVGPDGISRTRNYIYNEYGDLTQIHGDNHPITFAYIYDSHGNWTRKTSIFGDDSFLITERVIEYF